jgi:hypothetical protein
MRPGAGHLDWRLLAAAVNLARSAALGIGDRSDGWAVATI